MLKTVVLHDIFVETVIFQKNSVYLKYNFATLEVFSHIFLTVFNIDNNQFLDHKSAYYYDFWRSCDTEDWSNDAEKCTAYSLTHSHRNQTFNHKIYIFDYFSIKCSLGVQRDF